MAELRWEDLWEGPRGAERHREVWLVIDRQEIALQAGRYHTSLPARGPIRVRFAGSTASRSFKACTIVRGDAVDDTLLTGGSLVVERRHLLLSTGRWHFYSLDDPRFRLNEELGANPGEEWKIGDLAVWSFPSDAVVRVVGFHRADVPTASMIEVRSPRAGSGLDLAYAHELRHLTPEEEKAHRLNDELGANPRGFGLRPGEFVWYDWWDPQAKSGRRRNLTEVPAVTVASDRYGYEWSVRILRKGALEAGEVVRYVPRSRLAYMTPEQVAEWEPVARRWRLDDEVGANPPQEAKPDEWKAGDLAFWIYSGRVARIISVPEHVETDQAATCIVQNAVGRAGHQIAYVNELRPLTAKERAEYRLEDELGANPRRTRGAFRRNPGYHVGDLVIFKPGFQVWRPGRVVAVRGSRVQIHPLDGEEDRDYDLEALGPFGLFLRSMTPEEAKPFRLEGELGANHPDTLMSVRDLPRQPDHATEGERRVAIEFTGDLVRTLAGKDAAPIFARLIYVGNRHKNGDGEDDGILRWYVSFEALPGSPNAHYEVGEEFTIFFRDDLEANVRFSRLDSKRWRLEEELGA